jgi:hypothetical protein
LSPATRIEAGPVECQAVWLDCTDSGRCFEAIAILEIQALGGWHAFNFTANPASWLPASSAQRRNRILNMRGITAHIQNANSS